MSGIPSLTILSEEQKFNGDNLLQWKMNITQLLGLKGLLGYINGKVQKPIQAFTPESGDTTTTAATSTPIYSFNPTLDEWVFRDQLARGHITLNCTDIASLGVVTTGTAKDAWDSINAEWGRSTDMHWSHAQEALNRTKYAETTDIQDHIKLLRTCRAALDNLSTQAMSDEAWRGAIIRSIPPTARWLPVIPSLYAMATSADIISTLLAHGMILGRGSSAKATNSSTVLAARTTEGCTNPNCKAKKRSTHTTSNCYWPGGGKEGQFPPNFGQRAKANLTTSTITTKTTPSTSTTPSDPNSGQTEHFVLSAQALNTPGLSGVVIDKSTDHPHMALISKGFSKFGKGKVPTFMDSGAGDTMFVLKEAFTKYKPFNSCFGDSAKAKDGTFKILGEGNVVQKYFFDGKEHKITYTRALHTPSLNANLISVAAFDRAGLSTTFGDGKGVTKSKNGTVVLSGDNIGGMYILNTLDDPHLPPLALISLSQPTSLEQWHRRFSHCSPSTIKEMASNDLGDDLKVSEMELNGKCEDCIMGRQTRRPFDGETEKNLQPLDLVSFDLWGPSRVQSAGGKTYLMIIVDAATSFKYGAYLSDKTDSTTLTSFEVFSAQAELSTGRKVHRLHTDGAFEMAAWKDYCQRNGITHELTAPYSSSQNGLAERAIRTTIDDVRTLLCDSGLGHSYWAEAAAYSIYTRNLIPSRRSPGRIPLELFSGKRQGVGHLRVFGAKCWAKVPTVNGQQVTGGSKLDPRSLECRLLGYGTGTGNYKVQDITTRRTFISRDVIFEEGRPRRTLASLDEPLLGVTDPLNNTPVSTVPNPSSSVIGNLDISDQTLPEDHHNIDQPHKTPVIPVEQRRSARVPHPSNAGIQSVEYQQREVSGKIDGHDWATDQRRPRASTTVGIPLDDEDFLACFTDTKASHYIPRSYRHAMSTDPDRWMVPMKIEMETLKSKHTWDLVKPPPGANIMDSMWVYDIKWDGEGNRIKDKARLVGKGYTQQLGVD